MKFLFYSKRAYGQSIIDFILTLNVPIVISDRLKIRQKFFSFNIKCRIGFIKKKHINITSAKLFYEKIIYFILVYYSECQYLQ